MSRGGAARGPALVLGGGAFGVAAALELARRGHPVTLCDAGPIPHPDAASTDVSKAVRLDYGSDALYVDLMERALAGWRALDRAAGGGLFHETGVIIAAGAPLAPGGFEHDSFVELRRRGVALERLGGAAWGRRFARWRGERYPDGYVNPLGGWASSGAVVAHLLREARRAGVTVREGAAARELLLAGERVDGARLADGERVAADTVVVAAGAWTPRLVPELAEVLTVVGQPVVHLAPDDPARWRPPHLLTWAADVARTGFYGFPALPDGDGPLAGTVKVAHHGPGTPLAPDAPRSVTEAHVAATRAFLATTLPELADAPLAATRLCLYTDTPDGDFWIDRHPRLGGLVVATGGSGHAFKFAPVLGGLIADVAEGGEPVPRFAWRTAGGAAATRRREGARQR